MRKLTTFTAIALLMAGSAAAIADGMPSLKDKPVAAAPTPDWDIAFGGSLASNYMFRGISQSANWPSGAAYAEYRYNIQPTLQLYSGSRSKASTIRTAPPPKRTSTSASVPPSISSPSISAAGTTGIPAGALSMASMVRRAAPTAFVGP